MGSAINKTPKGTSLHGKTSYDVIDRQNRSNGATSARDEETKKERKEDKETL